MNKNAERIKNAVLHYKGEREAANEKIKTIRDTYGQEAGAAEARIQESRLEKMREAARNEIHAAHLEGRRAAESWATMDGSKLTDDAKLLASGLVDVAAFNDMKVRYKDNYTMLKALEQYGKQQNRYALDHGGIPAFETRDIPTAETKAHKWDVAKEQALDMINLIDGNQNVAPDDIGTAFQQAATMASLETFGGDL